MHVKHVPLKTGAYTTTKQNDRLKHLDPVATADSMCPFNALSSSCRQEVPAAASSVPKKPRHVMVSLIRGESWSDDIAMHKMLSTQGFEFWINWNRRLQGTTIPQICGGHLVCPHLQPFPERLASSVPEGSEPLDLECPAHVHLHKLPTNYMTKWEKHSKVWESEPGNDKK